jgi:hypothetical protein
MGSWLESYAELQGGLAGAAAEVFDRHYRRGVLHGEAFEEAPEYLWPFLMKLFWEKGGLPKPHRDQQKRLTQWLREGSYGCFDHHHGRFFCDIDGLTIQPHYELVETAFRYGREVAWGPWKIRFTFTEQGVETLKPFASILIEHGGYLSIPQSCPKKYREVMRKVNLPHRYRNILPECRAGAERVHFVQLVDWSMRGLISFDESGGEGPLSLFF